MSSNETQAIAARQRDRDIFVAKLFLGGARNYIRKTTRDAPWLSMGIMEHTNPEVFHSTRLFGGMNLVGGPKYSLGHGLIHGYLAAAAEQQIGRAVASLNALPADEIIFYHDESMCGIAQAREMGMDIRFRPTSLLEWLVGTLERNAERIRRLEARAAVQLPCSFGSGEKRDHLLDALLELVGVERVPRCYDRGSRLCCGVRGYYGLLDEGARADADVADALVSRNVEDARAVGAEYLVTICPGCYSAIAPAALRAGLKPIQVEGLASLALNGEELPAGLAFS